MRRHHRRVRTARLHAGAGGRAQPARRRHLRANFGEAHIVWGDIADLDAVPPADVVIGGPPCQGFSNLGSKDVDDPRNQLWRQYLRVVQAARPQVFVIENVDRFRRSAEFAAAARGGRPRRHRRLQLTHGVLHAADYGVPQRRARTIVIGSRIGTIALPADPQHRPGRRGAPCATPSVDLPELPDTTELPRRRRVFGRRVPGVFKGRDLHFGRKPRELSLRRYDCVPPGGGRFDLPDELLPRCWRDKPTGTTDVMGRMRWDQPSLTIRTEFFKPEKGQYLHPQWDAGPRQRVNRVITHLEAALLQEFPETSCGAGPRSRSPSRSATPCRSGLAAAIAAHLRPHLRTRR